MRAAVALGAQPKMRKQNIQRNGNFFRIAIQQTAAIAPYFYCLATISYPLECGAQPPTLQPSMVMIEKIEFLWPNRISVHRGWVLDVVDNLFAYRSNSGVVFIPLIATDGDPVAEQEARKEGNNVKS